MINFMKKSSCAIIVILLSFVLSCCSFEQTKTVREDGAALEDGTKTHYINILNEYGQIIKSTHLNEKNEILDEYEYEYTYDLNGKTLKSRKKDTISGEFTDTEYDKFKNKIFETYFGSDSKPVKKVEFSGSGGVKRTFLYTDGQESGYIIYDYYSDGQIKNESEYSKDGKALKITTYYKNNQLYQIKEFGADGMVSKITKYSYKGDELVKESVYNSEFELTDTVDYSTDPPQRIHYENGEPVTDISE